MQHCVLVLSGVEGQRCSIETCLCPTKTPADNQAHFYTVHFILPTFLSTGATPIFNRFYILGSNYTDQFMSMQPRHLHAKHTDTSPRDRKHLIIIDLMGGGGGGLWEGRWTRSEQQTWLQLGPELFRLALRSQQGNDSASAHMFTSS